MFPLQNGVSETKLLKHEKVLLFMQSSRFGNQKQEKKGRIFPEQPLNLLSPAPEAGGHRQPYTIPGKLCRGRNGSEKLPLQTMTASKTCDVCFPPVSVTTLHWPVVANSGCLRMLTTVVYNVEVKQSQPRPRQGWVGIRAAQGARHSPQS